MKDRWVEIEENADKNQEKRFETWLSGKDIPFSSPEAKNDYQERVILLKHAIQLKKPSRVPICPAAGFFPVEYANITMYDAMYDYDAMTQAWMKYCRDFAPDAYNAPTTIVPGRVFDVLDYTLYKWAGHGLSNGSAYQFVEGEYMKAEEYQDLIDDPTGFFMRFFFPRTFRTLKPLEKIPLLPPVNEMPMVMPVVIPFGMEDVQEAFRRLMDAGKEAVTWFNAIREVNRTIMSEGYPSFSAGITKAPFDVIGDSLRGTREVVMDMYRRPDELLEACERITPFMIKSGVAACRASGHVMSYIPLHKGADGFMNEKQFATFYWPTLKKVIIGLVNEGIVPVVFPEGGYNSRLEIVSDLPKAKVVWLFDKTDMARAKETVGKVACIAGNVPLSLLATGTPDDVKAYCKNLIDKAGKDGGFILSTSAGMANSRPENVKAMIDFSKEYGVYQ